MKRKIDIYGLDDIGFVGGGRPPTEEDFKAVSAYIQAQKKKAAAKAAKKAAKKKTTRSKKSKTS